MLLEPNSTRYDLNFELFGTPVRVHPLFWVLAAILGWSLVAGDNPLTKLAIWVMVVFLSILLHEFGHVWVGKAFGSDGHIVLYSFGGLAINSNDSPVRWQRLLVSLGGPAIQLALWAAIYYGYLGGSMRPLVDFAPMPAFAMLCLLQVNFYWPLFNLLPIWPLDGGQVCREVCTGINRYGGERISLFLSIGVAGLLAINSLMDQNGQGAFIPYAPSGSYSTFLFAILAFESYMLLQRTTPWKYEGPDDRLPWER